MIFEWGKRFETAQAIHIFALTFGNGSIDDNDILFLQSGRA